MDLSSSDLEFFDFKNSSDEEIKEIQAILKGPGSNGCVELPWEISVSNSAEALPETEGVAEAALTNKPPQSIDVAIDSGYAQSPPVAAVDVFVTLPTTVYQNAPYFVSRTLPYLRAYPPMGVPFFACPIPPGEASPYRQFVPVAAEESSATGGRAEKRTDSAEPVPLPPSSFAVYPPGLHSLPYTGQATSPAMYYVPVFNHPYGGYLPPMMIPETADINECSSRVVEDKPAVEAGSPVEAPAADCDPFKENASNVQPDCQQDGDAMLPAKTTELDSSPSSSKPLGEGSSPSYLQEAWSEHPPEPVAPSLCLQETVASNDCQPEPVLCQAPVSNDIESRPSNVDENSTGSREAFPSNDCPSEHVVRAKVTEKVVSDPSRCWADLFKGPREVNGIDRHPPKQRSTLKKDITNGKVYSMNH